MARGLSPCRCIGPEKAGGELLGTEWLKGRVRCNQLLLLRRKDSMLGTWENSPEVPYVKEGDSPEHSPDDGEDQNLDLPGVLAKGAQVFCVMFQFLQKKSIR